MSYGRRTKRPRRKPYNTLIFEDPRGPGRSFKVPIIVAAVLLVVTAVLLFWIYWNKSVDLGEEQLELWLSGTTMRISWEDSEGSDFVRLYRKIPESENPILLGEFNNHFASVTDVTAGEELTLEFEPVKMRYFAGHEFEHKGQREIITIVPKELIPPTLTAQVNSDDDIINVSWKTNDNFVMEIYDIDGAESRGELYSGTDKYTSFSVGDGEGKDFLLPERGKPIRLVGRVYLQEENCKQYSGYGETCEVNREDFLPDTLEITPEYSKDGKYRFSWEEAKPDTYEFRQFNDETYKWETLKVCSADDELNYVIDWLPSEKIAYYKVVAYYKDTWDGTDEDCIESEKLTVRSRRSPLYCTIWPVINLDVYTDTVSKNVCDEVKAGQTLCVLSEENGYFEIRCSSGYGYIDENYVLINLPEYLGDLVHYDITNSYSSLFRTQDYPIPGLTDTVIPGFENICLDAAEKEFVVPYLFPCSNKLAKAAEKARTDNYVFLIHDAFRPHEATRYMYDTTSNLLGERVPFLDEEKEAMYIPLYRGPDAEIDQMEYDDFTDRINEITAAMAVAEGFDITTEAGIARMTQLEPSAVLQYQARKMVLEQEVDPESETGQAMMAELIMGQPTYEAAMTNGGSMSLSAFLAQSVSAHNRGIALDMTIETIDTEEILDMQSPIHDLSFRSVAARNNDNANILKEYMINAGFNDLSSEWWHFQDSTTSKELGLGSYLEKGVSLEGWKKNNIGWRYQQNNGEYFKDTEETIDGNTYSFDENGYCKEYK